MRFGHVAIRVSDIEKALEFYSKGLGFKEAFKIQNDDGSIRIVYVHISDGQYLELCLGGEGEKPGFDDQKSIGVRHISFTVDNLEEFKKEAGGRGVVFDSGILNTEIIIQMYGYLTQMEINWKLLKHTPSLHIINLKKLYEIQCSRGWRD